MPATAHVLPPGYPTEFERRVRLRDGREADVRPILPSDAPELAAAIHTADAETLHRRFLGAAPHPTTKLLNRLTQVDYRTRFALVAIDPSTGKGIAISRYEPLTEGVAEVAIVVVPDWRRAGLASALLTMLAEAAVKRGVRTFAASYLAENRPVAALVSHSGAVASQLIRQGVSNISVALDRRQAGQHSDADSDRPVRQLRE